MLQILFSAAILLVGGLGLAESTLLGRFVIHTDGGRIGGLSAVHLSPDGASLIALSDRGTILAGNITRNTEGQIVDIAVSSPQALTCLLYTSPSPRDS